MIPNCTRKEAGLTRPQMLPSSTVEYHTITEIADHRGDDSVANGFLSGCNISDHAETRLADSELAD